MSTAYTATLRSTSTDGFRKNARDSPTPPTQPLIGPRENRRHSLGVGRVSTGFIVLVRVRQTQTGLRPDGHDGDRPVSSRC